MTALKRRARALEDKFALDQDLQFKAEARTNKIVGLWAATIMGIPDAEAYARSVAEAAVLDQAKAYDKLQQDFANAGIDGLSDELHTRMAATLRAIQDELYRLQ